MAYQWLLEAALVRLRWWQVPLLLLLIPGFPVVPPAAAVMLALGLALGNAGLAWLLRRDFQPRRLRLATWAATGLEWSIGLGVIGLFGRNPAGNAPAILLVLLLLTALRFGWRGLVAATAGAYFVVGLLVAVQVMVLRVAGAAAAAREWASWGVFIALMVLAVAALVHARRRWWHWDELRWVQESTDPQRLQYRLSPREWELLPLLAEEDLTYEQVGAALHISPETVKTHVRRIGVKLGAIGGRHAMVAAARERGLVPRGVQESRVEGQVGNARSVTRDAPTRLSAPGWLKVRRLAHQHPDAGFGLAVLRRMHRLVLQRMHPVHVLSHCWGGLGPRCRQ